MATAGIACRSAWSLPLPLRRSFLERGARVGLAAGPLLVLRDPDNGAQTRPMKAAEVTAITRAGRFFILIYEDWLPSSTINHCEPGYSYHMFLP